MKKQSAIRSFLCKIISPFRAGVLILLCMPAHAQIITTIAGGGNNGLGDGPRLTLACYRFPIR